MKVSDVMTKSVVCAHEDETCHHVAALLWANDIGAAPVLDRDQHIVGMVTDRDLCMGAYTKGARLSEIPVSEVMAHTVMTISPDETLTKAEELMGKHQLHRLPVVKNGALLGMLTVNDLARCAASQVSDRRPELGCREVTETLAGIATPRAGTASPGTTMVATT